MVPVLIAMVIGPMLAWKRGDLMAVMQRLWLAFAGALAAAILAYVLAGGSHVLALLGLGLAGWTGTGVLVEWADRVQLFRTGLGNSWRRALGMPRAAHGMTLAHFGLAITVAGISATAFDIELIDTVKIGGTLPLGQYQITLEKVEQQQGPNYVADNATIVVREGGTVIATMHPQRRFFTLQQQTTSQTAIRTGIGADLYVALGDPADATTWTVRAFWKPLVSWIWFGALVMAFGGLVSLSDRRWRVGVAQKFRRAPATAAAAGE